MSLDPLASKYADLSPYVSYGNNPMLFVDSDGDSIRVSKLTQWITKGWLQTLTNDKLTVKAGVIVIEQMNVANTDKKLTAGTGLVRELIAHKETLRVSFNRFGINQANIFNPEKSENGEGTSVVVDFDRFTKIIFNTKNKETGKTELQSTKNEIVLGHELIHALRAMNGESKPDDVKSSHLFKGRDDMSYKETHNAEELETTGLTGDCKYTENKIRKEQGEGKRVSYSKGN